MKHEKKFYLQGEGDAQPHGPFTEQELRRYWAYGIVKDDDWVWHEGMEEFVPVRNFFHTASRRPPAEAHHPALLRRMFHLREHAPVSGEPDRLWLLQVLGWLGALAATVCFLSLPALLWLPLLLYAVSLAALGWFIWLRKSALAWISLGVNVALMMTVIFFQPRDAVKEDPGETLMLRVPEQSSAPAASE